MSEDRWVVVHIGPAIGADRTVERVKSEPQKAGGKSITWMGFATACAWVACDCALVCAPTPIG